MGIDIWHRLVDVITSALVLVGMGNELWSRRSAGDALTTGTGRRSDRPRLKKR